MPTFKREKSFDDHWPEFVSNEGKTFMAFALTALKVLKKDNKICQENFFDLPKTANFSFI